MNKELFLRIVEKLNKNTHECDDFTYTDDDGKIYSFDAENESWISEGKYETRLEKGILCEVDKNFKVINKFNYGVSRYNSRTGSYYSEWYYDPEPFEPFEIQQVEVPEVVIPAHTEEKWIVIK